MLDIIKKFFVSLFLILIFIFLLPIILYFSQHIPTLYKYDYTNTFNATLYYPINQTRSETVVTMHLGYVTCLIGTTRFEEELCYELPLGLIYSTDPHTLITFNNLFFIKASSSNYIYNDNIAYSITGGALSITAQKIPPSNKLAQDLHNIYKLIDTYVTLHKIPNLYYQGEYKITSVSFSPVKTSFDNLDSRTLLNWRDKLISADELFNNVEQYEKYASLKAKTTYIKNPRLIKCHAYSSCSGVQSFDPELYQKLSALNNSSICKFDIDKYFSNIPADQRDIVKSYVAFLCKNNLIKAPDQDKLFKSTEFKNFAQYLYEFIDLTPFKYKVPCYLDIDYNRNLIANVYFDKAWIMFLEQIIKTSLGPSMQVPEH